MKTLIMAVTADVESAIAGHELVGVLAEVEGVTRIEYRVDGAAWAWPDALPSEEDLAPPPKLQFASTKARDLAGEANLTVDELGSPGSKNGYTVTDVRRAMKG